MIFRTNKPAFIHPQSIGFWMEQYKSTERVYADGSIVPYMYERQMTYIDFDHNTLHIDGIKQIGGKMCG